MRAIMIVLVVTLTLVLLFSMTAAWYTNVTQTGGLMFTTETWDFDGEILVGNTSVTAQPGDEGYVSIRLINNGETIAAASVTVSKHDMDELMKKRIYFYVETSQVRSEEKMDRVYISEYSSYTYTVFQGDTLIMGEDYHNTPAVKWMWVYDVLGYYVVGNYDGNVMEVLDYVRPVQYAYDEIKTTFDGEGKLLTVDGNITVDEFLMELTSSDGYVGVVENTDGFNQAGYCPIDVNEDGYGVWLYLCTRDEIIANAEADTALSGRDDLSCTAQVNVSGTNSRVEAFEIANAANLQSLVSVPTPMLLELSADVAVTETLAFVPGSYAVLDLGGNTLTSTAEKVFDVPTGATVTIVNGTISCGDGVVTGIAASGASVTLDGVVIEGVDSGVTVRDHENGINADSAIYIRDSKITGDKYGLWIYSNEDESSHDTVVVVENSEIYGQTYAGIICNGSYGDTDIRVSNCTVKGFYTGIYHPQKDSTLTVTESIITGYTGMAVKGGTVNIVNSSVCGTGALHTEPAYQTSGWTDTGDGIYLEASYECDVIINISGDNTTVKSDAEGSVAVRKYKEEAPHATISISGGSFDSDVSAFVASGYICTYDSDKAVYTVTAAE